MDKNKFTETLKKMCDLALESKIMSNVEVNVYVDKSTKCEYPKPPRFICQLNMEIGSKCENQCDHCKKYYDPLNK